MAIIIAIPLPMPFPAPVRKTVLLFKSAINLISFFIYNINIITKITYINKSKGTEYDY